MAGRDWWLMADTTDTGSDSDGTPDPSDTNVLDRLLGAHPYYTTPGWAQSPDVPPVSSNPPWLDPAQNPPWVSGGRMPRFPPPPDPVERRSYPGADITQADIERGRREAAADPGEADPADPPETPPVYSPQGGGYPQQPAGYPQNPQGYPQAPFAPPPMMPPWMRSRRGLPFRYGGPRGGRFGFLPFFLNNLMGGNPFAPPQQQQMPPAPPQYRPLLPTPSDVRAPFTPYTPQGLQQWQTMSPTQLQSMNFPIGQQIVGNAESGMRDVSAPNTTSSGVPRSYFQITDGTWRDFAPRMGVNLNRWPTAANAPPQVQSAVANIIPIARWTAGQEALKARYPWVTGNMTLGQFNSMVASSGQQRYQSPLPREPQDWGRPPDTGPGVPLPTMVDMPFLMARGRRLLPFMSNNVGIPMQLMLNGWQQYQQGFQGNQLMGMMQGAQNWKEGLSETRSRLEEENMDIGAALAAYKDRPDDMTTVLQQIARKYSDGILGDIANDHPAVENLMKARDRYFVDISKAEAAQEKEQKEQEKQQKADQLQEGVRSLQSGANTQPPAPSLGSTPPAAAPGREGGERQPGPQTPGTAPPGPQATVAPPPTGQPPAVAPDQQGAPPGGQEAQGPATAPPAAETAPATAGAPAAPGQDGTPGGDFTPDTAPPAGTPGPVQRVEPQATTETPSAATPGPAAATAAPHTAAAPPAAAAAAPAGETPITAARTQVAGVDAPISDFGPTPAQILDVPGANAGAELQYGQTGVPLMNDERWSGAPGEYHPSDVTAGKITLPIATADPREPDGFGTANEPPLPPNLYGMTPSELKLRAKVVLDKDEPEKWPASLNSQYNLLLANRADVVNKYAAAVGDYFKNIVRNQGNLPPNQLRALLKQSDPVLASLVDFLGTGRMRFPGSFALRAPYWSTILSITHLLYPNVGEDTYLNRQATERAYAIGKEGQQVMGINVTLSHLDQLYALIDNMNNLQLPALNWLRNAMRIQGGDPRATSVNMVRDFVMNELERAMRGTGGSEHDIARFEQTVASYRSPAQLHDLLDNMVYMLAGKMEGLAFNYARGTQVPTRPTDLLMPEALQIFNGVSPPVDSNVLQGLGLPTNRPDLAEGQWITRKGSDGSVKHFRIKFGRLIPMSRSAPQLP